MVFFKFDNEVDSAEGSERPPSNPSEEGSEENVPLLPLPRPSPEGSPMIVERRRSRQNTQESVVSLGGFSIKTYDPLERQTPLAELLPQLLGQLQHHAFFPEGDADQEGGGPEDDPDIDEAVVLLPPLPGELEDASPRDVEQPGGSPRSSEELDDDDGDLDRFSYRTYDPFEEDATDDDDRVEDIGGAGGAGPAFQEEDGDEDQGEAVAPPAPVGIAAAPIVPAVRRPPPRRTTMVFQNIHRGCHRDAVVNILIMMGVWDLVDFLYYPFCFDGNNWGRPKGYAFVNAISEEAALRIWDTMHNFREWGPHIPNRQKTPCRINWADDTMGLEANIERWRHSPVMHATVPNHWKPILKVGGVIVPYPGPDPGRVIKPPRQGPNLVNMAPRRRPRH